MSNSGMRRIELHFEDQTYPVWLGQRCLDGIVDRLAALDATSYHVVTDQEVGPLHAQPLVDALAAHGVVRMWTIAGGESGEGGKTLATVGTLAETMLTAGADRRSVVVAVGGGVVGNIAGLLAALLFRGIRLVHVPTTLIAMGDSVASLKQAVNLSRGKNLLGCFYTPTMVLADVGYLHTLPPVQVRSGMCEIIKNALAVSSENRTLLEGALRPDARYDGATLERVVEAGLLAKQRLMVNDRTERGTALVFEYGHTVGHAIELAAEGVITHGEAVALGMIAAAEIAWKLGHLSAAARDLHYQLIARNGTPTIMPAGVAVEAVMALVRADNKRGYLEARADQVPMVLLSDLGEPMLTDGRPLTLVDTALVAETISMHLVSEPHAARREAGVR